MNTSIASGATASVRALTVRSVVLVVVLAGLLGLAMAVLFNTMAGLDEEADALERVGGQRMMSQRAALLAEKLGQPGLSSGQRQHLRQELNTVLGKLQTDIRWLVSDPDVPAEIVSLYATAWEDENGVMARFRDGVTAVLEGRGPAEGLNHREAMLFNEEVASRYRSHASGELTLLKQVSALAFAVLLVGLGGLYALVLRPAITLVQAQIRRQAALGDAIIASGHGVLLLDDNGVVTFANSYAEAVVGYDGGDGGLVGRALAHLVFSAYGEETAEDILAAAASKSWRGDVRLLLRDGIVLWVEMVVSASAAEGGFLVIFFDATTRREAEAKLRQARERLAAAIEAVDDGFALFDAEERLVLCNRRYVSHVPQLEPWIRPGITAAKLLEHAWKLGLIDTDLGLEQFQAVGLGHFRAGLGQTEWRLTDGRIVHVSERRTPEGGRVQLIADVTADNANRDQLRKALAQAEAANRSKTVFLSSMSHELRTPMNAILGFAQLLEAASDGTAFGPSQRRAVRHILSAGQGLNDLIGQVLMLAELEAGNIHLDSGSFDLAAVVNAGIADHRDRIEQQKLSLRVFGAEHCVMVRGDSGRMAEVIGHLLSNAIKFNRSEGHIEVTIGAATGGRVRLAVSDSGTGIADEVHDKVFQAFNRLGAEGSSIKGAGIGLTIARALVEQMGGSIGFSSVADRGSVFWVELPAAPGEMAAASRGGQVFGRVLALSGNGQNRRILETVALGYPNLRLELAETCAEVTEMAAAGPSPDLIIIDLRAGGGDAVSLCQSLRQGTFTRFLPMVAITDDSSPAEAIRLAALGFDGLLGQPLDPAELLALIQRYCQQPSTSLV